MDRAIRGTVVQTPTGNDLRHGGEQAYKATTATRAWTQLGAWAAVAFAIALLMRLVQLDSVPANLNPDEADTLTTYLLAKYTGYPTLFGFNWNGAPALNAYLIGWGWELSGRSMGGVRVTSALLTAGSCTLFFLLLYQIFRKRALAFGCCLLLMTNPWFLNFSRSGWENSWNTLTVLLIMLGFYDLYEQKKSRRGLCYLIAGAAAGFYFYHPGKLFMAAVLIVLLLGQIFAAYRVSVRAIATFVLVTGLLLLPQLGPVLCTKIALQQQSPLLQRAIAHPCALINKHLLRLPQANELPVKIQKDGWHRVTKVSVLAQDEPLQLLQEGFKKNLLGFFSFAREYFNARLNNRYIPLENPPIPHLVTAFYLIGLLLASFKYPYFPLFFLLVLLPVQVLSIRTPDAARAVHIVPFVFFFAGLTLNQLLELSKRYSGTVLHLLYPLLILGIMILALQQNMLYWRWIHSQPALEAREPAVAAQEYSEWLQTVTGRILAASDSISSNTSTPSGATSK